MHITVIGGSGFIGSRLGILLTHGKLAFDIVDISVSSTFSKNTLLADVRSITELKSAILENTIIINLAAEHRDDVTPISLYEDVNVIGAKNVCTVASERNVNTIVFTSSVAVYGFAAIDTDETGKIAPFNEYGRTKYAAEEEYKAWQSEAPDERTLVIVRPTVVFGEKNRGNVHNLFQQIASGQFVMVGDGLNRKSMAYVENVAAFLKYASTSFKPGVHIFNYVDKPDICMNDLVKTVNRILGKPTRIGFRLPYLAGYAIGKFFDVISKITARKFAISSIRIKKFCSNSVYKTSTTKTNFIPPVVFGEALERTLSYEFIESVNHPSE